MLTELYYIIDDFCKLLEGEKGRTKLLGSEKTRNVMTIILSEIATITFFIIIQVIKILKVTMKNMLKFL